MLDVATLNVKQQLTRIIASCAFNKFNSNPCSIQLRNSSDHVVLVQFQNDGFNSEKKLGRFNNCIQHFEMTRLLALCTNASLKGMSQKIGSCIQ